MTSDAELRVEVPPGDTVVFLAVTTRGPQSVISKLHLGSAVKTQMPLPPGAYSIEVKTSAGLHVRCTVPLVAGAETTVRVAP